MKLSAFITILFSTAAVAAAMEGGALGMTLNEHADSAPWTRNNIPHVDTQADPEAIHLERRDSEPVDSNGHLADKSSALSDSAAVEYCCSQNLCYRQQVRCCETKEYASSSYS